ncbi:MAG: cohesin domain-containing protein [Pseudomonadota bacterium]|nr:cohesin domain-containing protein [Pseudomonadota bacterium]
MFALKKIITAATLTFAAVTAQAVPTLTFSAPTVTTGSSVDVSVLVSDVTDLSTYSLSVGYDASLLAFSSIAAGSFLGAAADTDFFVINATSGTLGGIFGLTFASTGATGSGTLFTIRFDTLAAGSAFLNFSNLLFLNSNPSGFGDIDVTGINGAVSILPVVIVPPGTDVPEPATLLLLGVGGAAVMMRRNGAKALKQAA